MDLRLPQRTLRVATAGLAILAVAACGAGGQAQDARSAGPVAPSADLRGVCPARITIQTNWWPQAEYGAIYHLLGEQLKVDTGKKRVSGALVAAGRDTGVRLEVRAGGPATSFQQVSQLLHLDPAITLGGVATDEQVQNAAEQPTLAVFAPMDLNPQVLLWDEDTYPQFNTIADIGQSDVQVLYFQGATFMEFLVGTGILRRSQIDGGYDGSPARFVAENGEIVQQGYLTNEPYALEHEVKQWGKPVAYQLVHDAGYPIYPEALVIRPRDKATLAPCLSRLVPILQQATADYAAHPEDTNQRISELVEAMGGYPYSTERAGWAVGKMRSEGILANGTHTRDTVGDFEPGRVQKTIDIVTPILTGQGKPVPRLAAAELATNEFITAGVGLDPPTAPRR